MSVTERVHTFGESGSLVGVVTLPPGDDGGLDAKAASRPFVVILNAGLVQRTGPFRLSVDLARRLATRGSRVLRFDQWGIGDSPPRGGGADADEQAVIATRAAMSFLTERYGARQYTVGGLCLGAAHAHRVGLVSDRVEGLFLLDGFAYTTASSRGRQLVSSLKHVERWPAMGRRLVEIGKERVLAGVRGASEEHGPPSSSPDARTGLLLRKWPPVESVRADLERMLHRGMRLFFLYTGGWRGFNDVHQFDEMFPHLPRRDRVTVELHEAADHTFLDLHDREAMFASVERFVGAWTEGR